MVRERESMNNGKATLYDQNNELWFTRKIETALHAKSDKLKQLRLKLQECPYCYYISSKLGGAAMTSWECALCSHSEVNGSTNTPVLCWDCSLKEDRCRECGDKMFDPKKIKYRN